MDINFRVIDIPLIPNAEEIERSFNKDAFRIDGAVV